MTRRTRLPAAAGDPRKAPGRDRLDLGAALNGVAGLYKLQGRYGEAEGLYRRALDIVETGVRKASGEETAGSCRRRWHQPMGIWRRYLI